jgi:glycosidase
MTAAPAPAQAGFPHLDWTRQTAIYEVNIRQYTPEGTLQAFAAHLPRLKAMGVDILWLMPLQPIGRVKRKGRLGSYYAISDYTEVNSEFGTLADLRALVQQAHDLGMKLILDWVANHTAWDHPWTTQHVDWYKLDASGKIFPVTFNAGTPQVEYWTDVVALDYNNRALWTGMIDAMAYWVRQADIDGFRCDVAGLVPTPFWNEARHQLDALKPMFMLAEWSKPELHEQAFDMTYGWDLSTVMKQVAQGKAGAQALREWVLQPPKAFPPDAYRMRFTSNHDENSWHGTDAELYGPSWPVMTVLTFTLPGMPLIYGGQEAGLNKRLAFFDRDPIDWSAFPHEALFRQLLTLKHGHRALANGQAGAGVRLLDVGNPALFAFERRLGDDSVKVLANVSNTAQTCSWGGQRLTLAPWSWQLDAT